MDLKSKRFYVSLLPTDVTETAWEAAEEHLRQALQTAVDTPRGTTVKQAQEQRQSSRLNNQSKPVKQSVVDAALASPLQTLSAAHAAQNLAVFLKTRATTKEPHQRPWLQEAETLYKQVLHVQALLLNEGHPDMYVTKHSLAELLQVMGDEETANAVRQEIVDTYDPPQEGGGGESSSSSSSSTHKDDEENGSNKAAESDTSATAESLVDDDSTLSADDTAAAASSVSKS